MNRSRKDESGLSLVELLVVLLIVGILLAIAIPTFLSAQRNAHTKAATANLRAALSAAKTVRAEKQSYDIARSELLGAEPSLAWGDADGDTIMVSDGPEKIAWTNDATSMTLAARSKPGLCFWVRDTAAGTSYSREATTGDCDPSVMGGTPSNSSDAWNN